MPNESPIERDGPEALFQSSLINFSEPLMSREPSHNKLMKTTVAQKRSYEIQTTASAKRIAGDLIKDFGLKDEVSFGLPEVDDRSHIWRVPVRRLYGGTKIGEVVINAKNGSIDLGKTTKKTFFEKRLKVTEALILKLNKKKETYTLSSLPNTIGQGDSEELLKKIPAGSVDLVFTSPPYYNARPEYREYSDYSEYLEKMRRIIRGCHSALADGRFFVLNISPVLIRRASRGEASQRIAVPFDFHRLFIEEGFDFIDDIIWKKPDGAGWATSRGRRFAADRNPLQYKAVPVTEYVLVYRKKTNKLIDWHIRNHPIRECVEASKIRGKYDATNVWEISPSHRKDHPAIFPIALAEKVIKYYSFINDVVLDPFAGIGTVGTAALNEKRRFVLLEYEKRYIDIIKKEVGSRLKEQVADLPCS